MKLRIPFLALATVFGLAHAAPVKAQTLEDLKAQIQKMQRQIEQLEAQQKRQARTPPARAPSNAQVQQAQRAADQAKAAAAQVQQAQQNAQLDVQSIKEQAAAAALAQFNPPPGKPGGLTFRIPKADTTIRIYGFAKLNGTTDLTTRDRTDSLTAQSIQLFNTGAQRQGGDTGISARRSRLGIETWTPINDTWGEFHTQVEMDFAGGSNPFGVSTNTIATSNSYIPRLRLAYADFGKSRGGWGNLLFGQQASTFNDQVLLPIQWMSDWDYVGLSNVRQAQVRYTYGFANGLSVSGAVESPYSDVTTIAGTSYPDVNGGGGVGWQTTPDFAGRLLWRDPSIGLLALRAVLRPQINLNNNAATAITGSRFNRGTTGWGVGLTGVINLLDGKLVLMASGNAGQGLGRYLSNTSVGFGAVSDFGLTGVTANTASVDAVNVYGGMVGLQYFFTPTLRTNMSIGGARLEYPDFVSQFCAGANATSTTCSTTNNGMWAAAINLVWSPFKAVDFGIEYQHVERSLVGRFVPQPGLSTSGGIENRIQLTAIGRF